MNRCQLMGRLTADPELKTTPNGISVTAFSLAVRREYQKEQSDFIDIVAWRKTAELCATYCKKGQRLIVTGSIQTRTWEDKEGKKRKAVEVVADSIEFVELAGEGGKSTSDKEETEDSALLDGWQDADDLPF